MKKNYTEKIISRLLCGKSFSSVAAFTSLIDLDITPSIPRVVIRCGRLNVREESKTVS